MRFYLDNDVDAGVRKVLTDQGHECWTAAEAGLAEATDDEQTVYAASKGAALVTHDKEFTGRRSKNAQGQHIRLKCEHPDGPELMAAGLESLLPILHRKPDVTIELSPQGIRLFRGWL